MKSHLGFLSAFCPRGGGGVNKTMWNIGGGGGGKVRNIAGGGGGGHMDSVNSLPEKF